MLIQQMNAKRILTNSLEYFNFAFQNLFLKLVDKSLNINSSYTNIQNL